MSVNENINMYVIKKKAVQKFLNNSGKFTDLSHDTKFFSYHKAYEEIGLNIKEAVSYGQDYVEVFMSKSKFIVQAVSAKLV